MNDQTSMDCMPEEGAALVGRAWLPDHPPGPGVITVRKGVVYDLTAICPTVSDLLNQDDPLALINSAGGSRAVGGLDAIVENSRWDRRRNSEPHLLAPCDLQAVKACGVTFTASLLERVIEEKAGGHPQEAEGIRTILAAQIGAELRHVRPGSPEARDLKRILMEKGMWSAYLEVGIGPDAEVFTKTQPLSAVGHGMQIGIHPDSEWNNPEPEIVLAVNRKGRIVGATLGNDVNLRDMEGRSTLLLGRAKDNNGSCAIGPFIRLFDENFGMDDVRSCVVSLRVRGKDGFELNARNNMREISRDPADLVAQTLNSHHAYPDGMVLFLGTAFAPIQDRGVPGQGFTHHIGDIVEISSGRLGRLVNRVDHSDMIPPWDFGAGRLMRNLAERKLI